MATIGIFYGSTTGNTEGVAEKIKNQFGDNAEVINVADADRSQLESYKYLVLGASTWGIGDLQDDMDAFLDTLGEANLEGKKVALFGLGDADGYPDSFVDGIKNIFDAVESKSKVVGQVAADGYTYDASEAVVDDKFVGLPIDEDNESNLTDKRISDWVEGLKAEFN
ncbi:MAG: flavodoxin [Hyphomicrobiales bacterium]